MRAPHPRRLAHRARHLLVATAVIVGALAGGPPVPATATSTSGTDFWVAFFRNVNDPVSLDLFITGATSTPTSRSRSLRAR